MALAHADESLVCPAGHLGDLLGAGIGEGVKAQHACVIADVHGLGLDETALTDVAPADVRHRYTIELYEAERSALDDAAIACGVSTRSGAKLARAIVRSWLAHPWHHPPELVSHEFDRDGTGAVHAWPASLKALESEAKWPGSAADPAPVLSTLLSRLDGPDVLEVVVALATQLSDDDRAALIRALGG
ncbi:hypothetical protein DB30_03575 [Enhygromyxa salina]|uniref:Uncharacterized protein n=2 Tax=Enhygromyxa salina TaxID=215803 RepID=A0A0C1Z2A0_9BACT|nr:hypothetical protein DB30_03575 [Enhygromyxa salina]